MHRRGGSVLAVALVVALAGGATACGSSVAQSSSSTARRSSVPATLGLTPIEQAPEVSIGGLDTLPDLEVDPTITVGVTSTSTSLVPTSLDPEELPDPEPPPLPEAFESTNRLGTLEIPSLGMKQTLYEGVTLSTLNHGPGHWPGSAMPGQMGNVVIAGHRTSHTHPFRDLDQLHQGDEVIFTTLEGRNVYVVSNIQIVTPDALWIVQQTKDKTATLFACHPKGKTTQRIVAFLQYAPERSNPAA